jgi:hypothetical protein
LSIGSQDRSAQGTPESYEKSSSSPLAQFDSTCLDIRGECRLRFGVPFRIAFQFYSQRVQASAQKNAEHHWIGCVVSIKGLEVRGIFDVRFEVEDLIQNPKAFSHAGYPESRSADPAN